MLEKIFLDLLLRAGAHTAEPRVAGGMLEVFAAEPLTMIALDQVDDICGWHASLLESGSFTS
jgi:hypothetical protein